MFSLKDHTQNWAFENKVRLQHEDSTTSTFDEAKQNFLIDQDTSLTLYTAEHQTAGRGRGARTWDDTSGGCFLSTWSFKVSQPPQPILAPLVGLAIYASIKEIWPNAKVSLKAPNDILLRGQKTAGILIENVQQGTALRSLIGVGLNVLDHPEAMTEATSFAESLEHGDLTELSWKNFLSSLKWNLEQALVDGVLQHLSSGLCDKLLEALNANPNLSVPYDKVLPDGSLKQGGTTLPWMQI